MRGCDGVALCISIGPEICPMRYPILSVTIPWDTMAKASLDTMFVRNKDLSGLL